MIRDMQSRMLVLVMLVVCSGCNVVGGWMPADIDRKETLEALGSAGYQRLCSAFEGYIRDEYRSSYLIQAVCLAHGIQTTDTAVACGEAVQACRTTLPPSAEALLDSILAQASCSTVGVQPTGCSATVAQLAACLEALEDKVDALKFGGVCAAAGEPIDADWWRIALPAACTAIRELCPA